jgi:predicted DNA binding CopG/RHH family protein
MKNKRKKVEPIPHEFASYEEAAKFWDTHDTTDYSDVFRTVDVETELRKRHYEVEVDEDVIRVLKKKAHELGVPISRLASEMLRKELLQAA